MPGAERSFPAAGLLHESLQSWTGAASRDIPPSACVEIDQRFAFLYTIDATGKISRAQLFPDLRAALAAAESAATQRA